VIASEPSRSILIKNPNKKGEKIIGIFNKPMVITITAIIVIAIIYFVVKFYYKIKNEPSLYERLRKAGIHPTIRKPPKYSDLKGKEPKSNNYDKTT